MIEREKQKNIYTRDISTTQSLRTRQYSCRLRQAVLNDSFVTQTRLFQTGPNNHIEI